MSSLLIGPKGPNLLSDMAFIEETAHFNRERIPERVVHAKGATAFGEFVVTNSNISRYSKADLFSTVGKRTPVAVRFSHVTGESGYSDTSRDVRGFAVKFYTDKGNWDLVGNNFPVFFIRDPINFVSFIHSQKRNPKTHLRDPDATWDFISMLPESLHAVTMLYTERGTPDGFRHMHGYGVNTFKLVNSNDETFYAKFHWICNQKIKNLDQRTATKIAGIDPDYSIRDLHDSIIGGDFPSWTLKFQVMRVSHAKEANFNVLDTTKVWPTSDYPPIEIGTMKLLKNPYNYFAEVEQLAFSPGNMVAGIEASPDKMLIARMFSYADAQRYRLGVNYFDLPVNRPRCPVMTPTYNDGRHFTSVTPNTIPNYIPSIKHGKVNTIDREYLEHGQTFSGVVGRYDLSEDDNYSQVRVFVNKVLSRESREILASNLADNLKLVENKQIVNKVLHHYKQVEQELSHTIAMYMEDSNSKNLSTVDSGGFWPAQITEKDSEVIR